MSKPPAISRKVAIRAVICLFLLALLFAGFQWVRGLSDPTDYSIADTKGDILALKVDKNGSQAVILKADGTILPSPGYNGGRTDRDAVWRPDGNAVFFSSDREKNVVNVYRWNLMHNIVERRSLGTRSQLATSFGPAELGGANDSALITAGGFVLEFHPRKGTTEQVLPPVKRGVTTVGEAGAGGAASQFEAAYQHLGNSFRIAKWTKDKLWVAAVMRSEEGEILVLQSMTEALPPIPLVAGDRIDFDIDPKTGAVVYAVAGYRIPDPELLPRALLDKARKELAIRYRIGIVDPSSVHPESDRPFVTQMVLFSKDDKACFTSPSVSPDGSKLLVVVGEYKGNGNVEPRGLAVMPCRQDGGREVAMLGKEPVFDPSWSPNGDKIVYVKRVVGGQQSIFTLNADGTGETNVSAGKGDFLHPIFSPQAK